MRKVILVTVVAALGVGVAVPVVGAKSKPEPTFAVLKQARAAHTDDLPLSGTLGGLVVPGSTRFVGELGGSDVYVAKGPGDSTCFLHHDASGTGGGCIEAQSLKNTATYVGSGAGDNVNLIVAMPDAYTEADVNGKKLKAKDNVVLTTVPKKNGKLKIKGDSGTLETNLPFAPSP